MKTALKPKWIAALAAALAVSVILVLLSQWQFSRSVQEDVAPPEVTEKVQPFLTTITPGKAMLGSTEGQLVTATGHFDAAKEVLVPNRLQDGEVGYWVVTAFEVTGAPKVTGVAATDEVVVPVARGWIPSSEHVPAAPQGEVELSGRLLNAEGPELDINLPAGQVKTVAPAELTNLWDVTVYAAFVVSYGEQVNGQEVGSAAADSGLVTITVTATDQNSKVNWLNIFYGIEWAVFAGFAVFLWWRLVADDYRREQDELFDLEHDDLDNDLDNEPDDEPDDEPDADPVTIPEHEHKNEHKSDG